MEVLVDLLEPLIGDMGIDLGGGNGSVAKHGLHRSNISPIGPKIRRETMTQGMRMYILDNSGFFGVMLY